MVWSVPLEANVRPSGEKAKGKTKVLTPRGGEKGIGRGAPTCTPDCLSQDNGNKMISKLLPVARVLPSGERNRLQRDLFVLTEWTCLPVAVSQKRIALSSAVA